MLKEQSTQTLLTLEDIELLIQSLVPQKKLLVDFSPCSGVSLNTVNIPSHEQSDVTEESGVETEKISFLENTEDKVFDINSIDKKKPYEKSKTNRSITQIREDKSVKRISKTRQHPSMNTKDPVNILQSDICITNNKSCATQNNTGSMRKHKTKPNVLFTKFQTTESNKGDRENGKNKDASNFSCSYCLKEFASRKSLQAHIWIHEKDKEYSCERCGKTFLHATGLCLHTRTHTGERPFTCGTCGKSFISSSALRRHQLVHNRVRDAIVLSDAKSANVCPTCGKTFSQKGNLTVHMKIHVGRYDHVCKSCHKQFITSGDLKRHERVHSQEKPYTCDKCKKSFSTSSTLVCHMRSHSGERPYLCGVCGATFAILSHLKQHNKIHARGDLWPRRKGIVAAGENVGQRSLGVIRQADVSLDEDKNIDNTIANKKNEWMDSDKYTSIAPKILLPPDTPTLDFVICAIQPSSNNLCINSTTAMHARTISSAESPRGVDYFGEIREIQLISNAGTDVHMTEVTNSSHLEDLCSRGGIMAGMHRTISQGETTL